MNDFLGSVALIAAAAGASQMPLLLFLAGVLFWFWFFRVFARRRLIG